jgi:hypothetical protein
MATVEDDPHREREAFGPGPLWGWHAAATPPAHETSVHTRSRRGRIQPAADSDEYEPDVVAGRRALKPRPSSASPAHA